MEHPNNEFKRDEYRHTDTNALVTCEDNPLHTSMHCNSEVSRASEGNTPSQLLKTMTAPQANIYFTNIGETENNRQSLEQPSLPSSPKEARTSLHINLERQVSISGWTTASETSEDRTLTPTSAPTPTVPSPDQYVVSFQLPKTQDGMAFPIPDEHRHSSRGCQNQKNLSALSTTTPTLLQRGSTIKATAFRDDMVIRSEYGIYSDAVSCDGISLAEPKHSRWLCRNVIAHINAKLLKVLGIVATIIVIVALSILLALSMVDKQKTEIPGPTTDVTERHGITNIAPEASNTTSQRTVSLLPTSMENTGMQYYFSSTCQSYISIQ